MRHNRYVGFLSQTHRGYLVAFDMFWNVIESRRVDPTLGANASLLQFLQDYTNCGWVAESTPRYGCVFMQRDGVRILVEATPRNPGERGSQAFSPFNNPRH